MTAAITPLFKPQWAEAAALSGECEGVQCSKKVNVCVWRQASCGAGRWLHEVYPQVVLFTPVNWPLDAQGEN